MKSRIMLVLGIVCGWSMVLHASSLRLGRYFDDGMVLQRDKPNTIRGFAAGGARVTVRFAGQERTTEADTNGVWSVELEPLRSSRSPQQLEVSTANASLTLQDVLVGDVVLVALQTSVDISLGQTPAGQAAAAAHKPDPLYRAIRITTQPAAHPQDDLAGDSVTRWQVVTPESALRLAATAYELGRGLRAEEDVPLGLVDLNLGSAFPISWLSRTALEDTQSLYGTREVGGLLGYFDRLVSLKASGKPFSQKDAVTPDTLLTYAIFPSGGYNAVLHPLRGLSLAAVFVQLGNDYPHMLYNELQQAGKIFDREALNRAYVQTYDFRKTGWRLTEVTTPRIPREWRRVFADRELPIGLLLPPSSDLETLAVHHRELRELHRLTALENPGVGLILPGMGHVPFSAQPRDPALLAQRALAWYLGAARGQAGRIPTGPLFERLEAEYDQATIYFHQGTAVGLQAAEGALAHFEAADVNGVYSPVVAAIEGETIRIRSDVLSRIVHVRYNWKGDPDQGLVNAAGLPALPFRSQRESFLWYVRHDDNDLPMEYFTPAKDWSPNEVALVSGHLKTFGYGNFTGWIGPAGIHTGPFGPNMGVRAVKPGSPADGRIQVGDMIYSANGTMLGDKAWEVMAAAVTASETRAMDGKLVLGLRRAGRNLEVEVPLAVMGSYSDTAPYDCPKTERIITNLENWLVSQGGGAGFLNTDALFLLASGNPALQGFVRRVVYEKMRGMEPDKPIEPTQAGRSWHNSANAILLGEYFLATGDATVLPYLKHVTDRLAATMQPGGGWRHFFPGGEGYGLIPNAGLPGVMGMHFANLAGVDLNTEAFETAVRFYREGQAESGHMIYGIGIHRSVPQPLDPEKMATGTLGSYNGGLSAAGILMRMTGYPRTAHLCSLISAFAWNNTYGGHGGNFWNNFWTPLGAFDHGRDAFLQFWRGHRWYREMNRMYDGSLIINEASDLGAGTGVALVAPRARLQIVGAPASPFAADAPALLQPARAAYLAREYAQCAQMVADLLAGGDVALGIRPTVEVLGRAAREIQISITADLERMRQWTLAGDPDTARTFLPHLRQIMHPADGRLAAIETLIDATTQGVAHTGTTEEPEETDEVVTATDMLKAKEAADAARLEDDGSAAEPEAEGEWVCLVTEERTGRSQQGKGKVPAEEASLWRMKVVESLAVAPAEWFLPAYDDSAWGQTTLPISWRMYHTVLLRTTFLVDDPKLWDGLRFRAWLFRQQGIEIYLNGHLIGRVNNLDGKTGNVEANFLDSAVKHLRQGENTLAVTSRHNWRWGMLFMRVYNDGFGFRLDARKTL